MAPRSDPAAVLIAPRPATLPPSLSDERPPGVCQPSKAVGTSHLEQIEILESPLAILTTSTASVQSRYHNDGDGGAALIATSIIT
jgi:hypothetical protein